MMRWASRSWLSLYEVAATCDQPHLAEELPEMLCKQTSWQTATKRYCEGFLEAVLGHP